MAQNIYIWETHCTMNFNPIVETYRGVAIRKYPMIRIRVGISIMKKIIDARIDLNLNEKEAISKLNLFCECSQGVQILRYAGKSDSPK